jgi:hypothetical protein
MFTGYERSILLGFDCRAHSQYSSLTPSMQPGARAPASFGLYSQYVPAAFSHYWFLPKDVTTAAPTDRTKGSLHLYNTHVNPNSFASLHHPGPYGLIPEPMPTIIPGMLEPILGMSFSPCFLASHQP